jgi:hypothetical protein
MRLPCLWLWFLIALVCMGSSFLLLIFSQITAIVAENTELVSNVTGYGKQGYAISQI